MKSIPLTQGMVAIVDDEDYDLVSQFKWFAKRWKYGWSAARNLPRTMHGPRKTQRMHRLILMVPEGFVVDHRDRDGLNNTRLNLRQATKGQNKMNAIKVITRRSIFKGVYPSGPRWAARIGSNGVDHLGIFKSETEAALAYNKAATKRYGEFARLNEAE
jgi:hypothetical protein